VLNSKIPRDCPPQGGGCRRLDLTKKSKDE
jgi:hypothetical protein